MRVQFYTTELKLLPLLCIATKDLKGTSFPSTTFKDLWTGEMPQKFRVLTTLPETCFLASVSTHTQRNKIKNKSLKAPDGLLCLWVNTVYV